VAVAQVDIQHLVALQQQIMEFLELLELVVVVVDFSLRSEALVVLVVLEL
jgi:hypothetical protein